MRLSFCSRSPGWHRSLRQHAWAAVRSPAGKQSNAVSDRIAAAREKGIAIVAVARGILELMHTLLRRRGLCRYSDLAEQLRKLRRYSVALNGIGRARQTTWGASRCGICQEVSRLLPRLLPRRWRKSQCRPPGPIRRPLPRLVRQYYLRVLLFSKLACATPRSDILYRYSCTPQPRSA